MGLRAVQRHQAAEALVRAADTRTAIAPLEEMVGAITLADGYRVQQETLRLRRRAGDRRVGWKVGCTSAATRAELGIDTPIAGYLLASTLWSDGARVDAERFIAPGVEPEIAILMGRDLGGPRVTALDVVRAADGALPALEIVDSRFRDWRCSIGEAVADDALAAGAVVGTSPVPLRRLDLRLEGVVLEHNGVRVATAAGAEALGHPIGAVVWLANHLGPLGLGLKAGDLVLTGSLTAILRPKPGETVRATFTRLGTIALELA